MTYSSTTLKVHDEIKELVLKKLDRPGMVLCGYDTGMGKTTGFVKALSSLPEDTRVLIAVPMSRDADEMYKQVCEVVDREEVGVWTSTHDKTRPSDSSLLKIEERSISFTKQEADAKRILICTHAGEQSSDGWISDRDLVLVDEYNNPVQSDSLFLSVFASAQEKERKKYSDVLENVLKWVGDFQDAYGKGIGAYNLEVPSWVHPVLVMKMESEEGRRVQAFAKALKEGRAFYVRANYKREWCHYSWSLPFQDKTILFSATVQFEGWHYDPAGLDIRQSSIETDYSNLRCVHIVNDLPKYKNDITGPDRRDIYGMIEEKQQYHNHTLVMYPKSVYMEAIGNNDGRRYEFPDTDTRVSSYYGVDVGSNEYRHCDAVFLVSDHHLPTSAAISRRHGHGALESVDETILDAMGNPSKEMTVEVKKDFTKHHMKQMVARGCVRERDEEGNPLPMTLYHTGSLEDFLNLPLLFPGCKLEIEGDIKTNTKSPVHLKAAAALQSYTESDEVTIKDITELGLSKKLEKDTVKVFGSAKDAEFRQYLSGLYEAVGWDMIPGSKGRGKPSKWVRLGTEGS